MPMVKRWATWPVRRESFTPGVAGQEACASPYANLRNRKTVAEKYLVSHFPGIRPSLGNGELDVVFWLPCPADQADGLTSAV